LDFMAREGEELNGKGVLYPCTDAFLQFVSRNRKELSKWYELTLPKEEVVEGLVRKIVQYEWARKLGVPIPQTFFPKDLKEAREIKHDLRYPAFIKGQESHLWARQFSNKGFIVRGPDELERRLHKAFEVNLEVVVQKIIMPPGKNYGAASGYIGMNGNSTPMLTWRKGRQTPPNFGIGCYLVSERIPELMELGSKFMKGIGFIGPGMIGFKFDLDDQEEDDRDERAIMVPELLLAQMRIHLLSCNIAMPQGGSSQMGEFKEGALVGLVVRFRHLRPLGEGTDWIQGMDQILVPSRCVSLLRTGGHQALLGAERIWIGLCQGDRLTDEDEGGRGR
jgi:hypothetical protein